MYLRSASLSAFSGNSGISTSLGSSCLAGNWRPISSQGRRGPIITKLWAKNYSRWKCDFNSVFSIIPLFLALREKVKENEIPSVVAVCVLVLSVCVCVWLGWCACFFAYCTVCTLLYTVCTVLYTVDPQRNRKNTLLWILKTCFHAYSKPYLRTNKILD